MTDNPYVVGHLLMNGPDYWGELHVAPIDDPKALIEPITDEAIWMLSVDFPAMHHVDDALTHISDQSLIAEV